MKTSLKNLILEYIKSEYPNVVHKGEIGRKAVNEWGYENENAGRRCRELADDELIEPVYKNGQVGYKYKPDDMVKIPIVGTVENEKVKFNKQEPLFKVRRMF